VNAVNYLEDILRYILVRELYYILNIMIFMY
jgi:hypothetical protein